MDSINPLLEKIDSAFLWGLSKLPPETAHEIGKELLKAEMRSPGRFSTEESKISLFGTEVDNPLGLAAGYDKYAEIQDHIRQYGFGWVELGSFTHQGGKGNPKPRLFRDKETGGLINRMGLNCLPSGFAALRLSRSDPSSFAVSIAKTHDPNILGDDAIEDMVQSYQMLNWRGIYLAVNVSCPNTKEGKTFESPESFRDLNDALASGEKRIPLVYKLSPNLEREVLQELVHISRDFADGYEIGNTLPVNHKEYGKGGLSGPQLKQMVINNIQYLKTLTDKPVLACGGVSTGEDAYAMIQSGAKAVLALNGFVHRHKSNPYAGPKFAHEVNKELSSLISQR